MSLRRLVVIIFSSARSSEGLQVFGPSSAPAPLARIYPTCKEACSANGCLCLAACGSDQAFQCDDCCCFCPSKPVCPLTEEKIIRANCDETLPGPRHAWEVLHKAFHTDLVLSGSTCRSSTYHDYFYSLRHLSLASMKIPPNTNILFYGNSYLNQILQNILIANDDVLIKNGPFGGFEGDLLDKFNGPRLDGFLVKWDFAVNSTIMQITNHEPLQNARNATNLKIFMQAHNFDIAFFMNPAPACAFRPCNGEKTALSQTAYCQCMCDYHMRRPNSVDNPNTCDHLFEGQFRGPRFDVSPLWDAIHDAMKGKPGTPLYEVEAWTKEEHTWSHTDSEHIIRTFPVLVGNACNQDDNCTNSTKIWGHQCQPGRVAHVSERLVAKMKEVADSAI